MKPESVPAAKPAVPADVDQEELKRRVAEHRRRKAEMIAEEEKKHFSYDVKSKATDAERTANEKLQQLKSKMVTPTYNVTIQDFYKVKSEIEASQLHQVLATMPKGGLHHVHTTAAPHSDVYIELTYDPACYYNERSGLFKVFTSPLMKEDGFMSCNEVRAWYENPLEYDEILRQ